MNQISRQESELFKEWKSKYNNKKFIEDGVIDENSYALAKPKILFLLKEANSEEEFSLKEFVSEGGRVRTWDNIYRWCKAIKDCKAEHIWSSLATITKGDRAKEFKDIAVINLKKESGTHTTNNFELLNSIERDKDFILKQIQLYKPDYIICCGSIVFREYLQIHAIKPETCKATSRGIGYIKNDDSVVINFCHPEARTSDNLKFYALLDAIREINRG